MSTSPERPVRKAGRPKVVEIPIPEGLPEADGLTVRQRIVLDMIRTSVETRGYPPSMREIGDAVGLTSPSSVAHQLAALEKKGYIRRDPRLPRAMEVVTPGDDSGPDLTGIGDAVDLSWKLEAVHKGWGGADLLTTYEAERRPIGLRNVAEASAYSPAAMLP